MKQSEAARLPPRPPSSRNRSVAATPASSPPPTPHIQRTSPVSTPRELTPAPAIKAPQLLISKALAAVKAPENECAPSPRSAGLSRCPKSKSFAAVGRNDKPVETDADFKRPSLGDIGRSNATKNLFKSFHGTMGNQKVSEMLNDDDEKEVTNAADARRAAFGKPSARPAAPGTDKLAPSRPRLGDLKSSPSGS